MPWQYHPFALTSGSLPVTRAGHCQDDPVSSCTDLNVTTLSAARPSYSPTWKRAGFFFLKVRGVFWLWVGFLPPASPSCGCRGARLPRCLESSGWAVCRHTCARRSHKPLQAGGQAGQAPAELLPVSHRYTPSQRAPHFLYHLITPKGCVRQAHPLPSSFPQTLTAPTGTTLPCAEQSRRLSQRLRKKLHISRTAMSCLLFPVIIYDKRKVIRAMKLQLLKHVGKL